MRDSTVWLYDRVIASDVKAARQALDELLTQLEAHRWPQRDVFAVHLATEEALVNAIRHGNGSDAAKRIHVVYRLDDERIRIEICDQGGGFDPTTLPDCTEMEHLHIPCGRGVMLMKAFMSRVEFNERGNAVVMEKLREEPAGTGG